MRNFVAIADSIVGLIRARDDKTTGRCRRWWSRPADTDGTGGSHTVCLVLPKVGLAVGRDSRIPSKELRHGDEILVGDAGTAVALDDRVPFDTVYD